MRAPSVLPDDYLRRWCGLAQWAVETRHGAAARFAIMYALALRCSPSAESKHIRRVRPRVWHVSAPRGVETQRLSLFDDALMTQLLDTVDATAGMHCPVFPRTPCGSQAADVWAHSMASRKQDHGRKNFAALSERFGVSLNTWSPLEIYIAGLSSFRACFQWEREHEDRLLSNQLGSHPRRAYYALSWLQLPRGMKRLGKLSILTTGQGDETLFTEVDDRVDDARGESVMET
jgi:hypothetical protein